MARPLVVGDEERAALRRLRDYAEKHPFNFRQVYEAKKRDEPLGAGVEHNVTIPFGFHVTFTLDQQPDGAWYRHASFSCDGTKRRVPNPFAVKMLATELGFQRPLEPDFYFIEHEDGPHPAVNIMERLDHVLNSYCICFNPSDYPNKFTVRRVECTNPPTPRELLGVKDTLEEARALIPEGMIRFMRNLEDEPQIVESWL